MYIFRIVLGNLYCESLWGSRPKMSLGNIFWKTLYEQSLGLTLLGICCGNLSIGKMFWSYLLEMFLGYTFWEKGLRIYISDMLEFPHGNPGKLNWKKRLEINLVKMFLEDIIA